MTAQAPAASSQNVFIGIDFGTTKTMVASYDAAKKSAKPLTFGRGKFEKPTSMYATEAGELLFGDDADDEGITDLPNHIRRFKMKLGKPGLAHVGRKSGTAQQLTAEFLENLRDQLENQALHTSVNRVILTVPAMFGPAQRHDLTAAAHQAGFSDVELLDEPVAAGIAYCDHQSDLSKQLRFIVVDWGGGTFDVAHLERLSSGEIKVHEDFVDGLDDIGGEAFDDELWGIASSALDSAGHGTLDRQPRENWGRYRRDLSRAKENLSSQASVSMTFTLVEGMQQSVTLDRADFNNIISPMVEKAASFVSELIVRAQNAGCPPEFILLAGGTSRIPLISEELERITGVKCRQWSDGREAIALGAAIKANELWGAASDAERGSHEEADVMTQAMSIYRGLLEGAWLDHKVTEDEHQFLNNKRREFKLSVTETDSLEIQTIGKTLEQLKVSKKAATEETEKVDVRGIPASKNTSLSRKQTYPTRNIEERLERSKGSVGFKTATEKMIQEWMVEAHKGDPGAQTLLGLSYMSGERVTLDQKEGIKWLRKAANQKEVIAQYCLGLSYICGNGVTQNPSQAATWFRAAALQKDASAKYELGMCYQEGLGIAQSDRSAAEWFRSAAEQGNADAQYALAICHRDGKGAAQNQSEYLRWLNAAADQDHAKAHLGKAKESLRDAGKHLAAEWKDWKKFWSK